MSQTLLLKLEGFMSHYPNRFTVRVPRNVGRSIHDRAAEWGVTPTAAASRLLAESIRMDVEHQHASLIEAVVERVLRDELGRIGELAFRGALRADETRRLLRPILERAVGEEAAKALRREIHSAAWQATGDPLPAPSGIPAGATWANGSRPS